MFVSVELDDGCHSSTTAFSGDMCQTVFNTSTNDGCANTSQDPRRGTNSGAGESMWGEIPFEDDAGCKEQQNRELNGPVGPELRKPPRG